jgi:hypothetical protein
MNATRLCAALPQQTFVFVAVAGAAPRPFAGGFRQKRFHGILFGVTDDAACISFHRANRHCAEDRKPILANAKVHHDFRKLCQAGFARSIPPHALFPLNHAVQGSALRQIRTPPKS